MIEKLAFGSTGHESSRTLFGAAAFSRVTQEVADGTLPLLLEIFGSPIGWIGVVWYLVVLVIATKEGTDLDLKFAGVSVLIGFAVAFLIRALLQVPFGLFAGALS